MTTRTKNRLPSAPLASLSGPKGALLDCPALRYNWGFHDARAAAALGTPRGEDFLAKHYDREYADGYRAGLLPDGLPIPTDSPAFEGWL